MYKAGTEANLVDADTNGKVDAGSTVETITGFVSTAASALSHDLIDVSNLGGFAGYAHASGTVAFANPFSGTFATSQTDFFKDAGGTRGAMISTDGTDSYVFIDANHDGNFTAAADLVIKFVAVANLSTTDINFG